MDLSAKRAELRSSGIDSSFRGKREDHFCRSRDEKKAGRVLESAPSDGRTTMLLASRTGWQIILA